MNIMVTNSDVLTIEQRSQDAWSKAISRMHYLMGTFVQIEVVSGQRTQAIEIIEKAFLEMKRIERILNRYCKESQVSKINQFASYFPVKIDVEIFQLLEEAVRFSCLTEGTFDITIGAILELFALAEQQDLLPAGERFKQAGTNIGYSNIVLDRHKRTIFFKKFGIKIDLGAMGKGYAVDKAIEILKRNKIDKALINAGGNIFCLDNIYSPIGIKNPCNPQDIIATILIKNKAISTSGNYERFFYIQGRTYGHLIDPQKGHSVDNEVLGVSIVFSSAKVADILSTAVFILGLKKGMRLIESVENLEGIIITRSGRCAKLNASSGLKEIFPGIYLS
jgi:thiamine biosynthesis lipoprotein